MAGLVIRTKSGNEIEMNGTYRECHEVQLSMMSKIKDDYRWIMVMTGSFENIARSWIRLSEIESIHIND